MYYIRKIIFVFAFIFMGATSVYGAELPPVASAAIKHSAKIKNYKNSLPPVAKHILFGEEIYLRATEEEEPVITESNWDNLPLDDTPKGDISDFFRYFQPKENVPKIITPYDNSTISDRQNVHIAIDYSGSEKCFVEVNSLASSSVVEIKDNNLVILSSKLVRGREYHIRVKAGNAYSDVVSFRIGNTREDEVARIIANTDIVSVKPRIPVSKMFPDGYFTSAEEAERHLTTITVRVWRAETETVEVDSEEIVDQVVRKVTVPVYREKNKNSSLDIYNLSTNEKDEAETVGGSDNEIADEEMTEGLTQAEEEISADDEEAVVEENTEQVTENTDEDITMAEGEEPEEITKSNRVAVPVIEGYTEITTVEYVKKTVKRTVNKGELYPSTARITVNTALADSVKAIFDELYKLKFPIDSVACYNWRDTSGGRISEHALGTAIDINPDQNYCVYGDGSTVGDYWRPYEDIYSVTPEVVNAFRKYNFSWGGSWVTPRDYMHFSYYGT